MSNREATSTSNGISSLLHPKLLFITHAFDYPLENYFLGYKGHLVVAVVKPDPYCSTTVSSGKGGIVCRGVTVRAADFCLRHGWRTYHCSTENHVEFLNHGWSKSLCGNVTEFISDLVMTYGYKATRLALHRRESN
jgi:hypothetical protein